MGGARSILRLICCVCIFLSLRIESAPAEDCDGQPQSVSARIVDNSLASQSQWPGIAALVYESQFANEENFDCGGNAVGREWVLTAAHCVASLKKNERGQYQRADGGTLRIIIGVTDLSQATESDVYEASEIHVYPGYSDAVHDGKDIALIRLGRTYQGAFATPRRFLDGDSPAFLRVAGFGRDGQPEEHFLRNAAIKVNAPSKLLRNVALPSISLSKCRASWEKIGCKGCLVSDAQLCAGNVFQHEDACAGDSGGPLVALDNKSLCPMLVGLVSWGPAQCGLLGHYSVYSRLSAYQDWIVQETKGGVTFKDVPPVRLSEQQEKLLNELETTLGPAKGRIKLFTTMSDPPKADAPYLVKVASQISGQILLISVTTAGNIIQTFPFVSEQVASAAIREGITDIPPTDLHMHFWTEKEPGEEQLIAILVPPSFPLTSTLEVGKYLAKEGISLNKIELSENDKLEYLISLIGMIKNFEKSAAAGKQSHYEGWGYDRISFQAQ
jgi:secreted trypsin-like serine protease